MNFALPSSATSYLFFVLPFLALAVLASYFYFSLRKQKKEISKEREESTRHLYELAILKELGERAGYSLNVEEILQIINSALGANKPTDYFDNPYDFYQDQTQADMGFSNQVLGFKCQFSPESGIRDYVKILEKESGKSSFV